VTGSGPARRVGRTRPERPTRLGDGPTSEGQGELGALIVSPVSAVELPCVLAATTRTV
jgi:hypothetical protein